jgi:hypothetical protein
LKELAPTGPTSPPRRPSPADVVVDGDAVVPAVDVCSEVGERMDLRVVNKRSRPIDIFWLDYDCVEIPKGIVEPGQEWTQRTQDAHRWRVRDARDQRLLREWGGVPDAGIRDYVTVP